ncbi:SWIM zinc finger family protein [Rhizobium leguminosarum]|uniref:SWIM zinc finger family protein n=1 Tax=Rhizobium leguminosarum TaxID=384 RepID=UPI002E1144BF|nr:SWIM zinc finger family protein [Rhizobium leguminosarum]
MSLSQAKIEALAPDQGSLAAAKKLLKLSGWPTLGDNGAGLVWGECQGSGSSPYRVCVDESDAGYKCTCPSRKFPCKHSLALMWIRLEGKARFSPGETPSWVSDWMSRRRGPNSAAPSAPRASMAAAEEVVDAVDEKALARAAASRQRSRADRESSILGGVEELGLWLSDQIMSGCSTFASAPGPSCRAMAQRLVDAKAGGLAVLVDSMPSRLHALPDAARSLAAAKELGVLHLISQAYVRQDALPPALREDVRQAVGWNLTREALFEHPLAAHESGDWRVWMTRSEVQPDKLRRNEAWLHSEDRFAVLVDYVPVSTGASSSGYAVGEVFEADLVYYPSSVPMRAVLARSAGTRVEAPVAPVGPSVDDAYDAYAAALASKPWLGDHPFAFSSAQVRRGDGGLYLCGSRTALPIARSQHDAAWTLLRSTGLRGAGVWNGTDLLLGVVDTDSGVWTP